MEPLRNFSELERNFSEREFSKLQQAPESCPFCDKVGIRQIDIDIDEYQVTFDYDCPHCEASWKEIFTLNRAVVTQESNISNYG